MKKDKTLKNNSSFKEELEIFKKRNKNKVKIKSIKEK